MVRDVLTNKMRILSIVLIGALLLPMPAFAQDNAAEEVVVTHGGYGAFAGALSLALFGAIAGGAGRMIYQDPVDANCTEEPERCRRTALEHILVGSLMVVAAGAAVGSGYLAQKATEKWEWNPVTGWALAGAYLGVPTTLMLQNAIPKWNPEWSRDIFGVALGVGGGIGAGYAFSAIARDRGHAWPEFGFGAGGMVLGLTIGTIVAKDTVWVPLLGGLGAVLGASAATLAF